MSKKRSPESGVDGEAGFVGAEGGVGSGEVDVVGDGYEGALGDVGRMPPAALVTMSVAQPRRPRTRVGKVTCGHGVALVGVDAALHDGYGDAADGAEDELAGVADDGGERPVGDVGVGDGGGDSTWVAKLPRPEPRMMPRVGLVRGLAADVVGGGLGLFE